MATRGLQADNRVLKHVGRINQLKLGSSDLRVGAVGPEQAEEWATVMLNSFGMPLDGYVDLMAATVSDPAFGRFAA